MSIFYKNILLAIILLPLMGSAAFGDQAEEVNTVEKVDLTKYMGKWYEIARIPNRFQNKCIGNVTANYILRADGKVEVLNTCLEKDGNTDTASGIAKIEDPDTNAKLKVSFFSIFGIHLFWGDYWILYLDEAYENVVVGDPSRKYGWILSRKTDLTPKELEPIYELLKENGYKPEDFVPTKQNIRD